MSIPPNSLWRGCAAYFPQPVTHEDEHGAQFLVETVYYFNCYIADPPLADIEYRSSSRENDILSHVFRWDNTPYQEVFQNGFRARRQDDTPDEVYFNLDHYVHHSGRPLDSRRETTHAFVSTTLNSGWHPTVPETQNEVYRYEIYAPGGIWVAQTLGDRYRYTAQDEICFVAGIAPQYIRSAQRFRLIAGRYTTRERLDNVIRVNGNYNPQLYPPRLLNIRRPIFDYVNTTTGRRENLNINICRPSQQQQRDTNDSSTDWYAGDVAEFKSYITAAFRSASYFNEAYLFMNNEYVVLDYAPGSTDKVVYGPLLICDGSPSLAGTAFAEHGIDCAFGSHDRDEAFIFSGNLCAQIMYAPHTKEDKIIKGPMTITAMFPFLKRTVFESGVDAAFESSTTYEAYLFKGDQYALINYGSAGRLISDVKLLTDGFNSLKNTIFATGFDAAFAAHMYNQAYLFKEESYVLINFADDYISNDIKNILSDWSSLQPILPRKNRGLDVHNHTAPESPDVDDDDRDHDEF